MRRGHYDHATAMRPACDLHATCNGTCNGRKALQVAAQTVRQPFRYRCARVAQPSRRHVSTASGPCTVRGRVVLKQWPLLALQRGCKRTWYASSRFAAKYARNQYPGRQQSQVATPSHRLCSACASRKVCHRQRVRRIGALAPSFSGAVPIVGATPVLRFLIRDFPVLSPPSACTCHALGRMIRPRCRHHRPRARVMHASATRKSRCEMHLLALVGDAPRMLARKRRQNPAGYYPVPAGFSTPVERAFNRR